MWKSTMYASSRQKKIQSEIKGNFGFELFFIDLTEIPVHETFYSTAATEFTFLSNTNVLQDRSGSASK